MIEALLYEKLSNKTVQCHICQRRCVIKDRGRGHCRTRVNHLGKLHSLIYGLVSTMMISPIEKKPVYHFFPGSAWFSLGSLGCNFRCPGCQNWDIAHSEINLEIKGARIIPPQELIQTAKKSECLGISWTYNEPTLWFEYTLEGAKLAKKNDLYTNYVTNGYMTLEALDLIGPYLDVFRVDLKGFSKDSYQNIAHIDDFSGILEVIQRAKKKWKMHVEIVTNLIPRMNDKEEDLKQMACWISEELGKDTPWHVTRFFPHLRLSHVEPTPIKTLEKTREMGMKQGLDYVYMGNVWGSQAENTYCPGCGEPLIEREGLETKEIHLKKGRCQFCGHSIAGRF
ncbi:MAG: AmmeMemoRadiSam system radical SAM enzyme [Candidatus Aminicenantes bacterium]|nr:AmmeMemoRadiSam system radical SAM enzyme [Candidatus Aminicenantes bacterium]